MRLTRGTTDDMIHLASYCPPQQWLFHPIRGLFSTSMTDRIYEYVKRSMDGDYLRIACNIFFSVCISPPCECPCLCISLRMYVPSCAFPSVFITLHMHVLVRVCPTVFMFLSVYNRPCV